jgi:hypothetical protein
VIRRFGRLSTCLAACIGFCALCLSALALADPAAELRASYEALKPQLADNPLGAPMVLDSSVAEEGMVQGEIYAVLESPFADLRDVFTHTAAWCDMVLLHINVKACLHTPEELLFYVGREYYQEPELAFELRYRFRAQQQDGTLLDVGLSAAEGPLGTHDYSITIRAIPLGEGRSFVHFVYSYGYGFAARTALATYLATLGRHKVGFTVTGHDPDGNPLYIRGLEGVVERNAMRYFLAMQSVLETLHVPGLSEEQRFGLRTELWHQKIQGYARQLLEAEKAEYRANKERERQNSIKAQHRFVETGERP